MAWNIQWRNHQSRIFLHENPFMLPNVCVLFLKLVEEENLRHSNKIKYSKWRGISDKERRAKKEKKDIFIHSFNLGHINWVFWIFLDFILASFTPSETKGKNNNGELKEIYLASAINSSILVISALTCWNGVRSVLSRP
jgi:hypothetical protein